MTIGGEGAKKKKKKTWVNWIPESGTPFLREKRYPWLILVECQNDKNNNNNNNYI